MSTEQEWARLQMEMAQLDADNWLVIPEFDVDPRTAGLDGFEQMIVWPGCDHQQYAARNSIYTIIQAARRLAQDRFRSLYDLQDALEAHDSWRTLYLGSPLTTSPASEAQRSAFFYDQILGSINSVLTELLTPSPNYLFCFEQIAFAGASLSKLQSGAQASMEELAIGRRPKTQNELLDARHAENRTMRREVEQWCERHRREYGSNDEATDAVCALKLVPLKRSTVYEHVARWSRDNKPAST